MDVHHPMPDRIKRLPVDHRQFPVPWFVAWPDGAPDFRAIDAPKLGRAVREKRCWICGDKLGQYLAFPIGPMCSINRVISEPPSHRECAEFSARVCPFLSRPRMRRNEKDLPEEHGEAAGLHIDRNPGAICIWITKSYAPFRPHAGNAGILFALGDPVEVIWYANGRLATREEVMHSIETGLPFLRDMARREGRDAEAALDRKIAEAMPLVPQ